jgi:hypothetical protein
MVVLTIRGLIGKEIRKKRMTKHCIVMNLCWIRLLMTLTMPIEFKLHLMMCT